MIAHDGTHRTVPVQHSRPHPDAWPADPHFGKASVGKLGMWIFLLFDAMSFAGFLLAYGILRGGGAYWRCSEEVAAKFACAPPGHAAEPILGINFTAVLTFLLICSSVTMVLAVAASQEGNRKQTVRYLLLTALGGALFLGGQYREWFLELLPEGLIFGNSHYATTFYLITGFHGLHVLTGTVYLVVMAAQVNAGWHDRNHDRIEICGLFWHFVDLIWIIVFTLVYLIPIT